MPLKLHRTEDISSFLDSIADNSSLPQVTALMQTCIDFVVLGLLEQKHLIHA